MLNIRQHFLENPIGGEVYVADMNEGNIIGIYGPLHFTSIKKQFLGRFGTGLDDVEWARKKEWKIIRLDEEK